MDTRPDEGSEAQPRPDGAAAPGRAHLGEQEAQQGQAQKGEAALHEEEETLRHEIARRTIGVRSMNRRLRLVTGFAIAQTVVAAVFIALRGVHLPLTTASNISNASAGVVAIPTIVLWISVALLSAAWAYVLAGAFDSGWPLRLTMLGVFTAASSLLWLNAGFVRGWGVAEASVVGLIWLGGGWTWWRRRRGVKPGDDLGDQPTTSSHPADRLPGLVLVAVLAAGVFALYLLFWLAHSSEGPASQLFASAIYEQMVVVVLFLVPALYLAGSEFAEWGEVVGDGITRLGRYARRHRRYVTAGFLAAVCAAVLIHIIVTSASALPEQLLCAAGVAVVVALALVLLRRHRGGWPRAVPYVAVLLSAVAFYVATTGDLLIRSSSVIVPSARALALGGDLIPYAHETAPRWGIEYPSGWTVHSDGAETIFDGRSYGSLFSVIDAASASRVARAGYTPDQISAYELNTIATGYVTKAGWVIRTSTGTAGPWHLQLYLLAKPGQRQHPGMAAVSADRVVGDRVWVLVGLSETKSGYQYWRGRFLGEMIKSWTPQPARYAAAEATRLQMAGNANEHLPLWALVAAGVVVLLCLLVLSARGARISGRRAASLLLGLVVASLYLASGGTAENSGFSFHWLHLAGVQAAVAIGSLLAAAYVLLRPVPDVVRVRRLSLLLMLNIGLQIVVWMYQLYGGAVSAGGQFSIAQGLIVIAALVWELTFSGVTTTRAHSGAFPRHARVLVFCGYIVLVATTVLFFSSLHVQATGTRLESVFESELVVQRGMEVIGVPLLVTVFLVRWLGSGASERHDEPGDGQASPGSAVADGADSERAMPELEGAEGFKSLEGAAVD